VRLYHNGTVSLEIYESDSGGGVVAKCSAVIWPSNADRILLDIEKATGAL
jgi:hypothetical protein